MPRRLPTPTTCTSSVLKQRDVSVKWLRSWIGLRTDMINRFPESGIRQIAVQAASIESTKKQRRTIEKSPQPNVHESSDGHTKADAPAKTEGGKESEKGKTRGPDPSSLVIAPGVAHMVIRRVTVERRLLEGQEQSSCPRARAVEELCPLRSGWILMRK